MMSLEDFSEETQVLSVLKAKSIIWRWFDLLTGYTTFLTSLLVTSQLGFLNSKEGVLISAALLALLIITLGYGTLCFLHPNVFQWSCHRKITFCFPLGLTMLVPVYILLIILGPLGQLPMRLTIAAFGSIAHLGALIRGLRIRTSQLHVPIERIVAPSFAVLLVISLASLAFRLLPSMNSYPLMPGYDTPYYARVTELYTQEVPIKDNLAAGGMILTEPPLYYILSSVLATLFGSAWAIPVFVALADAMIIFPLFMLYESVLNDSKVAAFGVALYSFSYFSIRLFQDLHKAVVGNYFLVLGLYCVVIAMQKKNLRLLAVSGFVFGLAINTHYWLSFLIFAYLAVYTVVFLRRGRISILRNVLFVALLTLASLVPEELYYYSVGGQSWLNSLIILIAPSGSRTPMLFASPSAEALGAAKYLIPSLSLVLLNDMIYLIVGGLLLLFLGRMLGLWYVSVTLVTLVGSRLFEFNILAAHSYRLWLYYGLFVCIFKAASVVGSLKILWRKLHVKNNSTKVASHFGAFGGNRKTITFVSLTAIAVMLVPCFDAFSYISTKKQAGLPIFDRGIYLEPPITENQYVGLQWLRSQIRPSDLIIAHIKLWSYSSYVFRNTNVTYYSKDASIFGDPPRAFIEMAYHLVRRDQHFFDAVSLFSNMAKRIFVLFPTEYDSETVKVYSDLGHDARFVREYTDDDIVIFSFKPEFRMSSVVDTSDQEKWTTGPSDYLEKTNESIVGTTGLKWTMNSSLLGWRNIAYDAGGKLNISTKDILTLVMFNNGSQGTMEIRLASDPVWDNFAYWVISLDFSGWMSIGLDLKKPAFTSGSLNASSIDLVLFGHAVTEMKEGTVFVVIDGLYQ